MVYGLVNVLYSTRALNFQIFIYYVASVLCASVTQIYIRSIGGYRSVPATLGSGIRGVTSTLFKNYLLKDLSFHFSPFQKALFSSH